MHSKWTLKVPISMPDLSAVQFFFLSYVLNNVCHDVHFQINMPGKRLKRRQKRCSTQLSSDKGRQEKRKSEDYRVSGTLGSARCLTFLSCFWSLFVRVCVEGIHKA